MNFIHNPKMDTKELYSLLKLGKVLLLSSDRTENLSDEIANGAITAGKCVICAAVGFKKTKTGCDFCDGNA